MTNPSTATAPAVSTRRSHPAEYRPLIVEGDIYTTRSNPNVHFIIANDPAPDGSHVWYVPLVLITADLTDEEREAAVFEFARKMSLMGRARKSLADWKRRTRGQLNPYRVPGTEGSIR